MDDGDLDGHDDNLISKALSLSMGLDTRMVVTTEKIKSPPRWVERETAEPRKSKENK